METPIKEIDCRTITTFLESSPSFLKAESVRYNVDGSGLHTMITQACTYRFFYNYCNEVTLLWNLKRHRKILLAALNPQSKNNEDKIR